MNDVAATRVSGVSAAAAERVSAFLRAVYGWMCVGLGVTAVVAYAITASPAVVQTIASNHLLFLRPLAVDMGLVGLVLASILGLFWHNDALQFLISVVGVIVFTGLTAWDAQRLKHMATELPEGRSAAYAIVGALSLYLNFINLFLILLRFTGGRRS